MMRKKTIETGAKEARTSRHGTSSDKKDKTSEEDMQAADRYGRYRNRLD